jgi:acyl carrier protein
MSDTATDIIDIIAREGSIDRAKIKPESTLKDLEIPSLDVVQIIFTIEDEFKISIPYDDPSFDVASVGGLIAAVDKLVAQNKPAA